MTNDMNLELSDLTNGTVFNLLPGESEGIYLSLEDEDSILEMELAPSHAYVVANLIMQMLQDKIEVEGDEKVVDFEPDFELDGEGCTCGNPDCILNQAADALKDMN